MILPAYKSKVALAILFISLQGILNCVNITLYNIFGDVFTFDMLILGNEAAAAFSFKYIDLWSTLLTLAIIGISVTLLVLSIRGNKTRPKLKQNLSLLLVFFFICSISIGFGIIKFEKSFLEDVSAEFSTEYFSSDEYLFETLNVKVSAFKKFGTYGLYMTDIYNSLGLVNATKTKTQTNETVNYLKNAKTASELGQTNSYTGLGNGKNVITIMVESLEWFAIDENLTPNLYNFSQTALNFQTYYARNKTNVSEGIGILGSYPKDTQFTTFYRANNKLKTIELPFSLPNMIKTNNPDAITTYMHNYYGYFYGRELTHPAFGFDNTVFLEDMNAYKDTTINPDGLPEEFHDFMLDSIMFENYLDTMVPSLTDQFYTHITTVTMHGGYDYTEDTRTRFYERLSDNRTLIENNLAELQTSIEAQGYTWPTTQSDLRLFKNYKAAAIDTDKAIGSLLNYLNTQGILDNTIIIIYGDHNTYMTSLANVMRGVSKTNLFNTELYRIPLMIYDKDACSQYTTQNGTNVVDTFTCTFNIVPTTLDLLGIDYRPAYYQGGSVFNANYDAGFISIIGGIIDNNFFSYDSIDILYSAPSATPEDLRIYQERANKFYEKQIHLERIYKYNLFEKLKD
ncbi:MAG: LTA synthase family protein [Clostridia bacterium]|nr:LTA synthase family protein [Clostridia bacterium]